MRAKENNKFKGKLIKFEFYIMSISILFVFIMIKDLYLGDLKSLTFSKFLSQNYLSIISAIFLLGGGIIFLFRNHEWKGASNPPYEIESIKSENFEQITFITTVILPLICLDVSSMRNVFILLLFIVLFGIISIKTNYYYANPTLALLGYRLYRAEIIVKDYPIEITLISKDSLKKSSRVKWIEIDENVWIVKEC